MLREIDTISQERFQKSGEAVLVETPKSHIVRKTTSEERRKSRQKLEKNMKYAISQQKEDQASDLVFQNRISWRTYNKLRKAEGLTTPRKQSADGSGEGEPSLKKRCGDLSSTHDIDKEKLLGETRTWLPDRDVNWSELAREYGIQSSNGGQMIKEFLRQNDIPAASIQQRSSRAPRRCKKRVNACSNITMPMYPTVMHEKAKLQERITTGEIVIGDKVVPTTYDYYSVDSETHVNICARQIPLQHICEKLLQKHEKMGILRDNSDEYFANLTQEEIESRLNELNISYNTSDDLKQKLKMFAERDTCKYGMTIHQ